MTKSCLHEYVDDFCNSTEIYSANLTDGVCNPVSLIGIPFQSVLPNGTLTLYQQPNCTIVENVVAYDMCVDSASGGSVQITQGACSGPGQVCLKSCVLASSSTSTSLICTACSIPQVLQCDACYSYVISSTLGNSLTLGCSTGIVTLYSDTSCGVFFSSHAFGECIYVGSFNATGDNVISANFCLPPAPQPYPSPVPLPLPQPVPVPVPEPMPVPIPQPVPAPQPVPQPVPVPVPEPVPVPQPIPVPQPVPQPVPVPIPQPVPVPVPQPNPVPVPRPNPVPVPLPQPSPVPAPSICTPYCAERMVPGCSAATANSNTCCDNCTVIDVGLWAKADCLGTQWTLYSDPCVTALASANYGVCINDAGTGYRMSTGFCSAIPLPAPVPLPVPVPQPLPVPGTLFISLFIP